MARLGCIPLLLVLALAAAGAPVHPTPLPLLTVSPRGVAGSAATGYILAPADIVQGPTVNLLGNTSVVIMWRTAGDVQSVVKYGTTTALSLSAVNSTPDTSHRIELSGLTPNTRYYYKVGDGSTWSSVCEFHTAPSGDEPFTFLVYGDHRPGTGSTPPPELSTLIDLMAGEHPAFVVSCGDHIQQEVAASWENYQAVTDRIHCNTCYWVAIGNHDQPGTHTMAQYYEWPGEAERNYYTFRYGNTQFFILDSETDHGRIGSDQLAWLESELANSTAKHRFVALHRPFFPTGSHIGSSLDAYPEERDTLWSLLEEYWVEAVFVAHEHYYYRLQLGSIVQIITGGGGAPLVSATQFNVYSTEVYQRAHHYVRVDVNGDKATYTVYDINHQVIDKFTILAALDPRPQVSSISHIPHNPEADDTVTVRALVNDTNVATVTCKYRLSDETAYTAVSMVEVDGNVWQTVSAIGPFPDQTLCYYYIEVNDTAGTNYQTLLHFFAVDAQPPTVAFLQPSGTEPITVQGTVIVEASAQDGIGVAYVEIYLDDVLVENRTGDTAVYTWDTTGVSDGPHTLKAIAYDLAGNSANATLLILVANQGIPTTPAMPLQPLLIALGVAAGVATIVIVIVLIRRRRLVPK